MNELESYQSFMQQQIAHIEHALVTLHQKLKETHKSNHKEIFKLKDQIDTLNNTLT
jgi:lipid II:glycine glycyltransferase (peptidoglycan interpeptide bridge formation enzyme)